MSCLNQSDIASSSSNNSNSIHSEPPLSPPTTANIKLKYADRQLYKLLRDNSAMTLKDFERD